MRDPFKERRMRDELLTKTDPESVKKYNAMQKALGGIPLDPYGSKDVCDALKAVIKAVKLNEHKDDEEYRDKLITHLCRKEGGFDHLSDEERNRVIAITKEYFK